MIRRYPCQMTLLFVLGILAAKVAAMQQETADTKAYGMFFCLWICVTAAALAGVWVYREKSGRKRCRQGLLLTAAFMTGLVRMSVLSDAMARQLSGILDEQKVAVQGRVVKKQQKETQDHTVLWTVYLADCYLKISHEIRVCEDVIVYVSLDSNLNSNQNTPILGNTIKVTGKTMLFHNARNDGNFNERAYYQNQGYAMKIYADQQSYQVMDATIDKRSELLYDVQQMLMQVYECTMPEQEAGVLSAMLIGEKSLLASETKELYRQSGIAHILAISGLHISILGASVFRLLRKKGVSYPAAAAISMGLLLMFGMMVGMGNSTTRAIIMFGIYLGAACCGRAYDNVNGLAVAAMYILYQNPRALFLAGFQFSFAAVAGVLFGQQICQIYQPKIRMMETVLMSLGIQMVTLPLTAWYYFEIPVYSVFLNMLVLPFMELVLILGLFGGLFGLPAVAGMEYIGMESLIRKLCRMLSEGLLWSCAFVLSGFSKVSELFLKLPGAVCMTGKPYGWQMIWYYVILAGSIIMVVFLKRTKVLRTSCVFCLCVLFVRLPKQAEVTLLDVGQGDGIYIRTSDGINVFIDGGSTDVKQVGVYRILPFLKSQGVTGIDYWFLSHLDQDHISGLKEIIDSGYRIGQVVFAKGVLQDEAYEKMLSKLAEAQIKVQYLGQGEALRAKNARFECLAPDEQASVEDRNARSMVLMYDDQNFRGFFQGDISVKEESALVAKGKLKQTVLYKAAHHGSNDSNTQAILWQLKPEVCVVSCAKENDYGHPGKEAVRNMEVYSGSVYYTMYGGRIRIYWEKGLKIDGFVREY